MEKVCRFCAKNEIPMFYSSCDSLYVKSKDIPKLAEFQHDSALGKMKVEAKSTSGAMFLQQGLYYVNEEKYSTKWVPHANVEKYCKAHGITVKDVFRELLDGVVSLKVLNRA